MSACGFLGSLTLKDYGNGVLAESGGTWMLLGFEERSSWETRRVSF